MTFIILAGCLLAACHNPATHTGNYNNQSTTEQPADQNSGSNQEENPMAENMIEAAQVLDLVLKSNLQTLNPRALASIVVDPVEDKYVVTMTTFAHTNEAETPGLVIPVDAKTGELGEIEQKSGPNPARELVDEFKDQPIISALDAYQAGLTAIKGYEHYDKTGKLEIHLMSDHYEVTFPDPAAKDGGARAPDYTYQVWIHPQNKSVLKILAAS